MAPTTSIELAGEIEADIRSGRLAHGERLEPVRSHASRLGVSPTTVAAAYRRLRERGLVAGRARQGTRVVHPVIATAHSTPLLPPGCVDAMSSNPDPSLLPSIDAALRSIDHGEVVRYGDRIVHDALADQLRSSFANDGVPADHLTITSGAMDAIERILRAHDLRPGDRIGVEDPGHPPVHQLARRMRLEMVVLAVDHDGVSAEAVRGGLDALVITPRAHNPTGSVLGARRAALLGDVHRDTLVIFDDHAGPVSGAPLAPLLLKGPRWAVVRSMAKSLGPDLRVAAVAGDSTTVQGIEEGLVAGPGWVSQILQRTAAHLLADRGAAELVAEAAETYRARRRALIDALAANGVHAVGESGMNVWVPVPDEQSVVEEARRAGFAIRAGDAYRIASPPAVRVTVTQLDEASTVTLADAIAAATASDRRSRHP